MYFGSALLLIAGALACLHSCAGSCRGVISVSDAHRRAPDELVGEYEGQCEGARFEVILHVDNRFVITVWAADGRLVGKAMGHWLVVEQSLGLQRVRLMQYPAGRALRSTLQFDGEVAWMRYRGPDRILIMQPGFGWLPPTSGLYWEAVRRNA